MAVLIAGGVGTYLKLKSEVEAVSMNTIGHHIYVEDVDVSGMTVEEAKAALEEKISDYQAGAVTLSADGEQIEVTLAELGLTAKNLEETLEEAVSYGKDGSIWKRYQTLTALEEDSLTFDITYTVDLGTIQTMLSEKTQEMGVKPQDATLVRKDGAFVVSEEVDGIQVDVEASAEMIAKHFDSEWEYTGDEAFELITKVKSAEVTGEALSQVKDMLGTFTTQFESGNNRAKNIALATSRINGTVLMPGDEISASDAMGERSEANGYLSAGTYLNGETVEGTGGGVCQVSTTLYNAALNAELEITERCAHSMTVSYVSAAQDAAIAEGYKDLKFKNNTDTPIYIEGYTKGGSVTFTIYGLETRTADRKVVYESKTLSTTEKTQKYVASGASIGTIKKTSSGHTGKKAELWKVVYENGEEVSREKVNTSSYIMSSDVYSVGTASDNAEATALVKKAIETQNRSKIDAAIKEAKALIAADKKDASAEESEATE